MAKKYEGKNQSHLEETSNVYTSFSPVFPTA